MAQERDEVPECSLDVTSELFDPLLALYSTDTPLPFPDVRCFNNLAEYESFLERGGRPRSRSQKPEKKGRKPAPDPERVQRLKKLMLPVEAEQSRAPRRGRKPPRNVLTRMALLEGSPVGRLYRCVQERLRVHVHTRTFRGLRGVCSGFIIAFDKCWNLAMVDVDETYRRPVLGRAFYSEPQLTLPRLMARLRLQEDGPPAEEPGRKEPERKEERPESQPGRKEKPGHQQRKKEKPDYQRVYTRHIQQVFIRGESVLLVHVPE
ncbi:U7 snRNA-associated Sm-like protein LSm11 [Dendrobates tinctorius]|uniref:U7 snRNA-associated Sm-like protein LSm11 n=1 Tax=Dendrobates tinctorius TaxID=92724 RepID=UPI003CCA4CAA